MSVIDHDKETMEESWRDISVADTEADKSVRKRGHTNNREPAVDTSTSDDHSPGEHPISPSAGQLRCSICQGTFRRPEHLKRHYRSHTKEKPFECLKCGRRFSRTDTLHRHELSHHAPGIEAGLGRAQRIITVKTFRACFKCAVARVRCSGGTPCVRCQNRILECQYPTERRSKSKASKDYPQISSDSALNGQLRRNAPRVSQSPRLDAEDAHHTRARIESQPQPSGHRINQFQFHFVDFEPDTASTSPVHAQQQEIPKQQSTSNETQTLEDSSDPNQLVLLPGDKEPRNISRIPYSYPDMNSQHIYQNIPPSSAFPVEPTPGLGQQVANVPAAVANSHMDIEMANASNQPVQMEFDQNLFDQSLVYDFRVSFTAHSWNLARRPKFANGMASYSYKHSSDRPLHLRCDSDTLWKYSDSDKGAKS
ncbi:hypothetical protein VTN00DRAFT_4278 [Thermoascus crustaceus]|uniref:uncharacterized protein n=1 Tax=Thermoascus crustaceus TaxID=5088 RepID=UPI0037430A74